ncbi:MAG: KpsF/GutQ family sugar-phosphate isomerase [Vampirovibrionales bacterium]|nr:KpsF/GutQ family sugar-phosphate isomerase [Vampirovibrionales bacterium]
MARACAVLDIEIQALQDLKTQLDDSLSAAIGLLANCQGRIIVTGMGKSGLIGRKIAATFSSTGAPALFLHPAEGVHGDLGALTLQDVVIAISSSGETPEILNVLPLVKRYGLPLIAMTGNQKSTLARRADVTLNIAVRQEACPLGLAPTSSTTVTLALGDVLAILLLERKGFTQDDFALFHPAGALGKRLLLRVADIMRAGEALPIITPKTPFLEALDEISGKKLGMALAVNESGQLEGVVTDGDIRRALTQRRDIHTLLAGEMMTRAPQTIDPDALAVSALRLMEQRKITTLAVVDAHHAPIGVVHMHDILNQGVS